jgi:hypothetical protein
MEDKYKGVFTYTDCIPRIYEMLTRVQELRNTPELIALAVNLTQNPRNAEVWLNLQAAGYRREP